MLIHLSSIYLPYLHPSIYLFISISIYLFVNSSFNIFIYLSFIRLSIFHVFTYSSILSINISIYSIVQIAIFCILTNLSIYQSLNLSDSIHTSFNLSMYSYTYLYIHLCVCQHIYLSINLNTSSGISQPKFCDVKLSFS